LLPVFDMFVRRCAWHPLYHGYGKLLGITSWRGWTVTFSDGLCERCAARTREEWGLPPVIAAPEDHRRAWRPAVAYATVALAASITTVVFGLALSSRDETGRQPSATVSRPTATEVAQEPAAKPVAPEAPRVAARVPAPDRSRSDEATGFNDRARVVGGTSTRVRSGIVRVRDRRAVSVASRARPEAKPVVASASPIASPMEPIVLFVPNTPAVVEAQAP
jgi:hypothetical protein